MFKPSSSLHHKEMKDVEISKQMFNLIIKIEEIMKNLKEALDKGDLLNKSAKVAELENTLMLMKSKADGLRTDVRSIMDLEVQNKDYITIHDDIFLQDKYERLGIIGDVLEELVDLLKENPTAPEFKKEFLSFIYNKLNDIIFNVNNIINDDKHLESTYSKLEAF